MKFKAYLVQRTVRYHVNDFVYARSAEEAKAKSARGEVEWSHTNDDDEVISRGRGRVLRQPGDDPR